MGISDRMEKIRNQHSELEEDKSLISGKVDSLLEGVKTDLAPFSEGLMDIIAIARKYQIPIREQLSVNQDMDGHNIEVTFDPVNAPMSGAGATILLDKKIEVSSKAYEDMDPPEARWLLEHLYEIRDFVATTPKIFQERFDAILDKIEKAIEHEREEIVPEQVIQRLKGETK